MKEFSLGFLDHLDILDLLFVNCLRDHLCHAYIHTHPHTHIHRRPLTVHVSFCTRCLCSKRVPASLSNWRDATRPRNIVIRSHPRFSLPPRNQRAHCSKPEAWNSIFCTAIASRLLFHCITRWYVLFTLILSDSSLCPSSSRQRIARLICTCHFLICRCEITIPANKIIRHLRNYWYKGFHYICHKQYTMHKSKSRWIFQQNFEF